MTDKLKREKAIIKKDDDTGIKREKC